MKLVIYNLLILILIPVFSLRILLKSFTDSDYSRHFANRLGYGFNNLRQKNKKIIWFHAVSLGEVIGSQPLINKLAEHFDIVITTTTPTGLRKAKEIFPEEIVINYAPWDLALIVNRFLNFYKPDAILIFETEIWPSTIGCAFHKNIPLYLVNGRLSHKSFQAYAISSWLLKNTLKQITYSFVQTSKHKERFLELGIEENCIEVAGSVKFDICNTDTNPIKADPFILGASTHPGEEEILLKAYKRLQVQEDIKLFLCPRHTDRAGEIAKQATNMGFKVKLYSDLVTDDYDICIVDSTGLLSSFYAASLMSFVGGSLVPRGGHNLIEPAALGSPIIIGPHTFNFEDIVNQFLHDQACIKVLSEDELLTAMELFIGDSKSAEEYARRAKEVVERNKGSTEVQASYIIRQLGEKN
ncbi:3-deoxy-D-manno-octulosonic-acid transferase [SAR86 cluster bacterium SAR86E]|uniref:3-deoxy-D-manno-octulosonic acid transferase n=1 Tax=SAR86 cluster bacterium SAR86E TaxID=1208365 RepID=K6GG29_9GAMM|nr:3-deoxy-D-manno-octulosonic-acid transferase [SAR86 cluster bacterium SAR86E]